LITPLLIIDDIIDIDAIDYHITPLLIDTLLRHYAIIALLADIFMPPLLPLLLIIDY
jgi:hypothetical protein